MKEKWIIESKKNMSEAEKEKMNIWKKHKL